MIRSLLAVAVVGAATVTAPAGAAIVSTQQLPGGSAGGIDPPSISRSARGDLAVAWRAGSASYVAVRRPGATRLGRPLELAARMTAADVGILRDGTVLVVGLLTDQTSAPTSGDPERSTCCQIVAVQRLAPRGRRLSAPHAVTVPGASVFPFSLAFATGGDGAALLVGNGGAAVAPSRGIFGVPVPAVGAVASASAVLDPHGRGAVLWVDGTNHTQTLRGMSVAGGRLGRARTYLPTPDARSDFAFGGFTADADSRGRLTVLATDTGGAGAPSTLRVAGGPASGPLQLGAPLATATGVGAGLTEATLDVSPSGGALAAWRQYGSGQTVHLALRPGAGAAFTPAGTVDNALWPKVAWLGARGGVTTYGSGAATLLRTVSPTGRLGAPRALPGATPPATAVLADGARRAVVAYTSAGGLTVLTATP